MTLSNLVKGMMVALPMMAITACSSSNNIDEQSQQTNAAATKPAVEQKVLTAQEEAQLKFEEQYKAVQQQNTVFFEFDSYVLDAQSKLVLDAFAEILNANDKVTVTIVGHTDERGTQGYNQALGLNRAQAVESYLKAKVNAAQITNVDSKGEEERVAFGNTEADHQKNRRAVLELAK